MNRAKLAAALVVWSLAAATGAEPDRSAEEGAIRKAVKSYEDAFNCGDAKALAELWSPEAVYTNPLTDERVVGRPALEKQFASRFADRKGTKLELTTDSIQFVSPNVAVEHGKAKEIIPKLAPEETEYSAVYVKRDGKWLLDRVTEEDLPVVKSNYERLKELEWMIGSWVDQDSDSRIETNCHWSKNQNFLIRSFTVSVRDRIDMSGMQIIGWDPAAKRIRSWVFDSDGGFAEAVWRRKGNVWHIQSTGIASDGSKSSSVNVLKYVDDNTFTWQSINRQAGGELLPNIDEVTVVRQKTTN